MYWSGAGCATWSDTSTATCSWWVRPKTRPQGRLELGRNASELLGHLECPLVIAPSSFTQHASGRLDRIGVGFDGGLESRAALDFAVSMAAGAGAALEVRWAIDDGVAGESLEQELAAATGAGVPAELEVEVGMPTDVLSELGDRVDMLVLGSGRSGPRGRVQPGATGRGTLRLVTCPVLVVPRPQP